MILGSPSASLQVQSTRPTPNAHGVFPPDQWTENLVHRTRHGYAEIHLVDCGDGWVWGYDYGGIWMGGGTWPSIHDPRLSGRAAALDAALDRLRHAVAPESHWEKGDQAAGRELLAWIDAKQTQKELFA